MKFNREDFEPLLKNFKPLMRRGKRVPYVLFGFYGRENEGEYNVPTLHALNCFATAGQPAVIDYYMNKGQRILDYWFPTDEIEVQKGQIAVSVTQNKGKREYLQLRAHIEKMKSADPELLASLQDEKTALQKRVEELEKKQNGGDNSKEEKTASNKGAGGKS